MINNIIDYTYVDYTYKIIFTSIFLLILLFFLKFSKNFYDFWIVFAPLIFLLKYLSIFYQYILCIRKIQVRTYLVPIFPSLHEINIHWTHLNLNKRGRHYCILVTFVIDILMLEFLFWHYKKVSFLGFFR